MSKPHSGVGGDEGGGGGEIGVGGGETPKPVKLHGGKREGSVNGCQCGQGMVRRWYGVGIGGGGGGEEVWQAAQGNVLGHLGGTGWERRGRGAGLFWKTSLIPVFVMAESSRLQ